MISKNIKTRRYQPTSTIVEFIILVTIGLLILIITTGGFKLWKISVTHVKNPLILLLFAILVRVAFFIKYKIREFYSLHYSISYFRFILSVILSLFIANNSGVYSKRNGSEKYEILAIVVECIILIIVGLLVLLIVPGGFWLGPNNFMTTYLPLTIMFLATILLFKISIKRGVTRVTLLKNPISYVLLIFFYTVSIMIANNYVAYVTFGFSSFHDLGLYNQAMFNFVHGRGFVDQLWGGNLFGDHSELFLVPLSLIYIFWQSPLTLLYVQGIVIASGIFPLYFLARQRLGGGFWPIVIILCYLTFPPILHMSTWTEFRSITFVIPIILAAFYFYDRDKKYIFVILMLLAGLVKEEVPPVIATTGLYIIIFSRKKEINYKVGLMLFVTGLVMLFFMIKIFIPYFGKAEYAHFYRFIGGSNILNLLIKDPLMIFKGSEFFSSEKINYFYDLFLRMGFIPFFSFLIFIPLSNWVQIILTPDTFVVSQEWHNTLVVTFMFVSLILGISNLRKANRMFGNIILYFLLLLVIIFGLPSFRDNAVLPLKSRGIFANSFSTYPEFIKYKNLKIAIDSIPGESIIYTTFRILPYVSSRQKVYWYPKIEQWSDVDYILFAPDTFLNNTEQDKLTEALGSGIFTKIKDVGEFQIWKRTYQINN